MEIKIAPSILAADVTRIGEEVRRVERAGAEYLHIDIMDGHFVPNLSFSPAFVQALRSISEMFFDVHLMLSEPEKYIEAFAAAGADLITVHAEAARDSAGIAALARQIHACGVKAGISVKPKTPAAALEGLLSQFELALVMSVEPGFGGQSYIPEVNTKITQIREMAMRENPSLEIEVDGGIQAGTIAAPVKAGANVLVAGSSVFGAAEPEAAVAELRRVAEEAARQ